MIRKWLVMIVCRMCSEVEINPLELITEELDAWFVYSCKLGRGPKCVSKKKLCEYQRKDCKVYLKLGLELWN